MLCLWESHLNLNDTGKLKVKGWKRYNENNDEKKFTFHKNQVKMDHKFKCKY